MLVLVGKTCSGKSTVAKILEKRGYNRIVTYTTRPKRAGEADGIDYHFITVEDFLKRRENGFFAETAEYDASFGHCYYGSAKADYTADKSVIVLNPKGIKQVLSSGLKPTVIYLNAADTLLKERAIARGDKPEEISRRLLSDEKQFAGIEQYADYTITIMGDLTAEESADMILGLISRQ